MDIFVQSLGSGEFLDRDLRWTTEVSNSMVFHSTIKALDFCTAHRLADVRLILEFEGGKRYELNLTTPVVARPQPDSSA